MTISAQESYAYHTPWQRNVREIVEILEQTKNSVRKLIRKGDAEFTTVQLDYKIREIAKDSYNHYNGNMTTNKKCDDRSVSPKEVEETRLRPADYDFQQYTSLIAHFVQFVHFRRIPFGCYKTILNCLEIKLTKSNFDMKKESPVIVVDGKTGKSLIKRPSNNTSEIMLWMAYKVGLKTADNILKFLREDSSAIGQYEYFRAEGYSHEEGEYLSQLFLTESTRGPKLKASMAPKKHKPSSSPISKPTTVPSVDLKSRIVLQLSTMPASQAGKPEKNSKKHTYSRASISRVTNLGEFIVAENMKDAMGNHRLITLHAITENFESETMAVRRFWARAQSVKFVDLETELANIKRYFEKIKLKRPQLPAISATSNPLAVTIVQRTFNPTSPCVSSAERSSFMCFENPNPEISHSPAKNNLHIETHSNLTPHIIVNGHTLFSFPLTPGSNVEEVD